MRYFVRSTHHMNHLYAPALAGLLLFSSTAFRTGAPPDGRAADGPSKEAVIPGDLLVMLMPGARAATIAQDLRLADGVPTGLRVEREVSAPMRIWLLHFDPGTVEQERMLALVRRHPAVMLAQNDHPVEFRAVPNDPQYGQQWHHARIQSPQAWDVSTGGTTATGDSIVVCVVEGANLLHPDLAANRWINHAEIPANGIDDDGNGYVDDHRGWSPVTGNDNAYSGNHGTQVAGMVGARGNNGVGMVGANWNVKIMPVTVGSLTQANVIASYTYPLVMRRRYNASGGAQGAFVVATNSSWGIDNANPANYPLWCAMYDTLGAAGILNCASTSNSDVNVDVVGDMPTACSSPYMISVTATNNNDMRTFSGYGATTIDVGAPGENVYTTTGTSAYGSTSGTSFAGPLTAGVIALLYSAPCPDLMELVDGDPAEGALYIRQQLFAGVDVGGNLPGQTVTGGRINANNSMQLVMQGCGAYCAPPTPPTINTDGPTAVNATWTGAPGETFDLRYRPTGSGTWTEVPGLATGQLSLGSLASCTTYEFQLLRHCTPELQSTWSAPVQWVHPACCTPVTVVALADRYGSETTWSVVGGGTTHASGGPYTNAGANGTYPQPSVPLCLPPGCYELIVADSYGDGLCCAYGEGYVRVESAAGAILATTPASGFSSVTIPFCIVAPQVQLNARVFLGGPFAAPMMSDALRSGGLIPVNEPYSAAGWPVVNGGGESIGTGVLAITGANAIVDWVRIELRDAGTPSTIVAVRHALVQRDGDIVDAMDGTSPIRLDAAPGEHHVVVRHRNHLGCMTATPIALSATPATLDLTTAATPTWGTAARMPVGTVLVLWAGDVNADHQLRYIGAANDRDAVLTTIGGSAPTATLEGYHAADVNMDGIVRYTGGANDRDPVLVNIGGGAPTAVRDGQVP